MDQGKFLANNQPGKAMALPHVMKSLYEVGDHDAHIYLVVSGLVLYYPFGITTPILIKPLEWFGVEALCGDKRRSKALLLNHSKVKKTPVKDLKPDELTAAVSLVNSNTIEILERGHYINCGPSQKTSFLKPRIARFILKYMNDAGVVRDITHQLLSMCIGVARESTTSAMKQLKSKRLFTNENCTIVVKDFQALMELAGEVD